MRCFSAVIAACCILSALALEAQEPKPAKPRTASAPPGQQLREAYEKTRTLASAEDLTEVIDVCERALAAKLSADDSKYGHDLLSWSYNRRGEFYAEQAAALIEKGQARKANEFDVLALQDFNAAVQHDPSRHKALHNRGVSLALQGKTKAAVADFDRVIELKPDFVNAWFNRAEMRVELRDFGGASEDYTESLRLKPNDVPAYVGRAKARLKLNQVREALADADRAMQLDSTHALARTMHGEASLRLGQWEQAADDFQSAVKLDGRCAPAYRGAAWLMAVCPDNRYRNAELALQAAEKSVKLGGEDYQALDVLAAAQANADQFDEALQQVSRALETAPEDEASDLLKRKDLYAAGKPFRLPAPKVSAGKSSGKLR